MKSITQVVENLIKPYIDSHDRAAEAIIAPVETNATSASDDYAVGKQLILNDVLYDVIAPITTGDALVVNTNIKAADKVSSDIEALTNKLNNEIVTRSELGAKNLLPYDIQKIKALNTAGTWNGNTYTPNNSSLNITLNTDGSITVDGTSASAATATLYIYGSASEANENIFKGMIASGCPSGGATNKYSLAIQGFSTTTPSGGNNYHDIGEGITVGNDNYVRVYVRIQNNTTVSNLTFKPMIRLASDPDATYQPYAKTNQELTAENQTLTNNKLTKMLITSVDDMPASKDFYDFEDGAYYLGAGAVHGTGVVNAPPIANGCSMYVNTNGVYKVFSVYPYSHPNAEQEPMYIACASSSASMKWTGAVTQNQITNPNLFDNPWFTVNQRGFTTKTFSAQQVDYSVDRWRMISNAEAGNSTITLNNGAITVSNDDNQGETYFEQIFENGTFENGRNYTLSVMLSDGTIVKGTNTMPTGNAGDTFNRFITFTNGSFYVYHPTNNDNYYVTMNINTGSITIKAVKLELGSVSTLAQDTAPNYATELLKCQRYYIKRVGDSIGGYTYQSAAIMLLPLPIKMRATPTITINSKANIVTSSGTLMSWSTMSILNVLDNGLRVQCALDSSAGDAFYPCNIGNCDISLSADL